MISEGAVLRGIFESISTLQDQTNYTDEKGINRTGELTIGQLKVLIYLMRFGEASGTTISKDLGMAAPTVSRIIALLSTTVKTRKQAPLGYVTIEAVEGDRRNKIAKLTPKGKQLAGVIVGKFKD